ncbi:sulfur carrier protein ThiS [Sporosarcina sp. Marseille-Q4943]|uniref:sulfur carrier protein ThiS n=1 Tax=Sporosarcina sp. Marseille-Q4943 TaxID=2942204 RepID=UPI00208DA65F|nr:sulfur carrier protein ThiS [Sporosarcina sp. Marseille-Q4943]
MEKVIELNGKSYEVPSGINTIQQLLDHLKLTERIAVVEVNRSILSKDAHCKPINDRDQIEIIHFVGGG